MSSQTRSGADTDNPVRAQWLPYELAVQEVVAFERCHGLKHLRLACHAALPSILSPKLLNLIHANFLLDEAIPWLAEIDFLLSPLCRKIGEELFEVEPSIREVLLIELERLYGSSRQYDIAQFYHFYLRESFDLKQDPGILISQQWVAEAYLFPDKVISEMNSFLGNVKSLEDFDDLSKQILLTNNIEILSFPLQRATQQDKYIYLTRNLEILAKLIYCSEQDLDSIQEAILILRKKDIPLSPVISQCFEVGEIDEDSFEEINLPNWLHQYLGVSTQNSTAQIGTSKKSVVYDENIKTEDALLISRAFEFAYELHRGQYRASGEPYIYHPIAVAGLIRELGGSATMIATGFLHDVVEDTDVTLDEIEKHFGSEVCFLVEGVTQISKINFSSYKTEDEVQAENFRNMVLAMVKDIRVIVVKLADRLHNMRTLKHLSEHKRRRVSLETRNIFAPLAHELGIGRIKWELEDLAFKYLEPEEYRKIQRFIGEKHADREARLEDICCMLRERLEHSGVNCIDINSWAKHFYEIYSKMRQQQKEFHQVYDTDGLRIIVSNNGECYRALAIVHDEFRPIPGRFKDYIGLPKPNGYQALHTGVINRTGRPIEIQIRTEEMHHTAEYESTTERKGIDDVVFVHNDQGEVRGLTLGATPVDFAYSLNTQVGDHCSGARINGRIVSLDTILENGDIVEIITNRNASPSLDWLNFVVSAKARSRIRQWYKRVHREENLVRGRKMLERELGKKGFDALLKSAPMQTAAERCNYSTVEDLLVALGYGETTLNFVINRLRDAIRAQQPFTESSGTKQELQPRFSQPPARGPRSLPNSSQSPIIGVEGLIHNIAKCCNPLPGDPIIGVVTMASRGISIHRQDCQNLLEIPQERLIPVSWNQPRRHSKQLETYTAKIQVEVIDRVGILKDLLSRLCDQQINVCSAQVKTAPGKSAILDLEIEVRDSDQLKRVLNNIKKLSDVLNVRQTTQ